jgi:hypothetical protein
LGPPPTMIMSNFWAISTSSKMDFFGDQDMGSGVSILNLSRGLDIAGNPLNTHQAVVHSIASRIQTDNLLSRAD